MTTRSFDFFSPRYRGMAYFFSIGGATLIVFGGLKWSHTGDSMPLDHMFEGLAFIAAAIGTYIFPRNARIEVSGSTITEFNGFGRARLKGDLRTARLEDMGSSSLLDSSITIHTEAGDIFVPSSINGFSALRRLLQHSTEFAQTFVISPFPTSSFVPSPIVYSYRSSLPHLFGVVWTIAMAGCVVTMYLISHTLQSDFLVAFGVCALPGIGCWMKGNREAITLGEHGIEWRDWTGQVKVRAELNQIIDVSRGPVQEGNCFHIRTCEGDIVFIAHLRDYRSLINNIRQLVAGRGVGSIN